MVALSWTLIGCASTQPSERVPGDSDAVVESEPRAAQPSNWNWLWAAPTNVVYWPWRAVARTGRGFVDGVILTFDDSELPGMQPFVLPLNALGGAGIGLYHSFTFDPNAITPSVRPGTAFGGTLTKPVKLIDRTPEPTDEVKPRPPRAE